MEINSRVLTIQMATQKEVKLYLAYWFQLGKRVLLHNGEKSLLPTPIFVGNHYSHEFEIGWQQILDSSSGDCYLEGTEQTIQQLLTPQWEISFCARCQMPVPMTVSGYGCLTCPCADLSLWPNTNLPLPHCPANTQQHLTELSQRLKRREEG